MNTIRRPDDSRRLSPPIKSLIHGGGDGCVHARYGDARGRRVRHVRRDGDAHECDAHHRGASAREVHDVVQDGHGDVLRCAHEHEPSAFRQRLRLLPEKRAPTQLPEFFGGYS